QRSPDIDKRVDQFQTGKQTEYRYRHNHGQNLFIMIVPEFPANGKQISHADDEQEEQRHIEIKIIKPLCPEKRQAAYTFSLAIKIMPRTGIEPVTRGFSVLCSTN